MQKHVFRDIKRPYIKILTQPSKWSAQINKSSPSNKRVALTKKDEINNSRGYYFSVGKSKMLRRPHCLNSRSLSVELQYKTTLASKFVKSEAF